MEERNKRQREEGGRERERERERTNKQTEEVLEQYAGGGGGVLDQKKTFSSPTLSAVLGVSLAATRG